MAIPRNAERLGVAGAVECLGAEVLAHATVEELPLERERQASTKELAVTPEP